MAWIIDFDPAAARQFKKLDAPVQRQILKYLEKVERDPLSCGYWLEENLAGLRKYRVGDWRLVADIKRQRLTVLVVKVGHRSKVYR